MRLSIREQLAALVIFTVLIALAIVSVPTWFFVHSFVTGVASSGLSLTASLKAARIDSELNLLQTLSQTVATRILLQQALVNFYNDNATNSFSAARADLESAMSTNRLAGLLQARLFSRNSTGANPGGLLNVTGSGVGTLTNNIQLPYSTPNGSRVNLSDTDFGYPPHLYPNITYQRPGYPDPYQPSTPAFGAFAFPGVSIGDHGGLLLGPLMINESFALMSITVPVRSLSVHNFILGYMTLIVSAGSLFEVQTSREGLGSTGMLLLLGPSNPSNHFLAPILLSNRTYSPLVDALAASTVKFVLLPIPIAGQTDRHVKRAHRKGDFSSLLTLSQYPAVLQVYTKRTSQLNDARALLSTRNEDGVAVAVGVARPQSALVDWAIVVEQADSEAYAPIVTLRQILLGCVFGAAVSLLILIIPCAHVSVGPIRRLKMATEKSMSPLGYEDESEGYDEHSRSSAGPGSPGSMKGLFDNFHRKPKKRRRAMTQAENDNHRRIFKIPGRVAERKHFVTDELTELTQVYNEMTDELVKQYTSLDEKVAERTRELEISKRAAEAANESKTLFIANMSHELKTPLNGIMGICAVCMEDDDVLRIRQSLKTLYRSGELLLHLLEDLLCFSKNQISQQIRLEDRDFRLGDIQSQIMSIFDNQARESSITLEVSFLGFECDEKRSRSDQHGISKGLPALGPPGMRRLEDVYLWGDDHRILQIITNLVSNSLKFTSAGGRVKVCIRCIGEIERSNDEGRPCQNGSTRVGRSRHRESTGSTQCKATTHAPALQDSTTTALSSSKGPKAGRHVHGQERFLTPSRPNAKRYLFEFEVQDTGSGIPEHMQERIFEPFVQVDSSLSKRFGGSGLGLSICSQLAKLMDGSISVNSTEGVGSTFSLRIPLKHVEHGHTSTASSHASSRAQSVGSQADQAQEAKKNDLSSAREDSQPRLVGLGTPFFAPSPAPPPNNGGQQRAAMRKSRADEAGRGEVRILVADDNSTNIEVLSRMLKLEKVNNVTIARDGHEACELVKANMEEKQPFDLIFMDVQMPHLDGLQSTRLIRKMGYVAPIVALTAFSEESNVKECMESGMDEFLSKPIRRTALNEVLTKFATIPKRMKRLARDVVADVNSYLSGGNIALKDPSVHCITHPKCHASFNDDVAMDKLKSDTYGGNTTTLNIVYTAPKSSSVTGAEITLGTCMQPKPAEGLFPSTLGKSDGCVIDQATLTDRHRGTVAGQLPGTSGEMPGVAMGKREAQSHARESAFITTTHEIGHFLGLGHVRQQQGGRGSLRRLLRRQARPVRNVMEPFNTPGAEYEFDPGQHRDMRQIVLKRIQEQEKPMTSQPSFPFFEVAPPAGNPVAPGGQGSPGVSNQFNPPNGVLPGFEGDSYQDQGSSANNNPEALGPGLPNIASDNPEELLHLSPSSPQSPTPNDSPVDVVQLTQDMEIEHPF
ncbi:ATPase-like, ATP-binding domain protein [Metarhizium album ARSEF 1941]|uniref:histidine kinase n=1 Tax=Metarhizium album (strain ARSEF 1941) TaxID=1081103 RepID=A0A0B2WSX2_METAS|nr:ATPase-like, ATP-binding domain protein [Metarhizium album ARSEF 1941]KHN97133.1 ATPase-like, ATP-binding domain protein [Metarhizium album ARSEF 1941]